MLQAKRTHHIEYQQVSVRYNEEVTALRSINLTIDRGEFVFLVGRTGTGKTTLLKLLSRDIHETSGRVILDGTNLQTISDWRIPALRRQMGIVPQDFGLLSSKKVWENVAYAMRAVGYSRRDVRKRVPEILERVRIAHRADAYPHQLSGGEQQRVAIGRALVANPPLLLADEPTGNLDPEHSMEIMEVLMDLNRMGTTVLVATHDMMCVERMNCRVITLSDGVIVEDRLPESPEASQQMALPITDEPSDLMSHAVVAMEDVSDEVHADV